jgi:hypothetical protein
MYLEKIIEDEIKRLKEAHYMNDIRKESAIDYLQWVLSELEHMNCKNCCWNNNKDAPCKDYQDLFFCSNFDEVKHGKT